MAAPGLAERTFLLTAATGDIAKALAHYAAAQGARLILQARPEAADALTAWAATLRNDGHSVETVSRTLQSAADAKALVTHAETHFGRIHAACLFTAQPPPASLLYCEEAALTAALGEVQAATVLLQALAQHWRGRGEHGALVLSAGTDAFFPSTQRAAAAMQ
ncbi:MAG: SDR family NAD(P)-dependent oxidoreductase, partial [Polyangiales bacterium]